MYHFSKTFLSGGCTPVQVISYSFHPILYAFTIFQITFAALSIFLVTERATCHISKKCDVSCCVSLIHLAIPVCRSETNFLIAIPDLFKKLKHRFAPSSSILLLLPVSFACQKYNIYI